MFSLANIILAGAAALTALSAGIFYGWSVSVVLGLARLSDREYVSFMQQTNRAIQNILFFTPFFGAALLLLASTFFHYGQMPRFWYLLAASFFYLAGVIGVTVFGNVPMNNRLDRFDLAAAAGAEISAQRKGYERRWSRLNHVRAVAATIAVILAILACLA